MASGIHRSLPSPDPLVLTKSLLYSLTIGWGKTLLVSAAALKLSHRALLCICVGYWGIFQLSSPADTLLLQSASYCTGVETTQAVDDLVFVTEVYLNVVHDNLVLLSHPFVFLYENSVGLKN